MTLIRLKPRSTTLFENEQQVRLRPNGPGTWPSNGNLAFASLGPNSTQLEETVTRVRKLGWLPNAVPAVSGGGGGGTITGAAIINGTFSLQGGTAPDVPTTYALTVADQNASITAGDITINYVDDTDTSRQDQFDIFALGNGPHYTTFPVKTVTSVVGANFVGHTASDTLVVGPACADNLHSVVGTSGREDFGPVGDPNDASADGDGSYVSANSTTDQRVYVGFPDLTDFQVLEVTSISIESFVKQIGAGVGIQLLFRLSDVDSDWVLATYTATNTDSGTVGQLNSGVLSTNPKTGNPWTLDDINNIQIGWKFLGENPTIEKRANFLRLEVSFRQGFVHDTLDGTGDQSLAYEAVNKDPFVTPSGAEEAARYAQMCAGAQGQDYRFDMEDLPAEALSVNSVATSVRLAHFYHGEQNGAGRNDFPCLTAVNSRGGSQKFNRLDGPIEQANLGGWNVTHDLPSALFSPRFANGPGDPVGGCGNFSDFDGDDVGWGVYNEKTFTSTERVGGGAITVADVNGLESGVQLGEAGFEWRVSRVYSQVEYLRAPTGSAFYHLAIDDDPVLAPDDLSYMSSQHSANKKFGVDFSGIPEVIGINSVKVIVRAGVVKSGGAQGWRITWRDGIGNSGSDVSETAVKNVGFANFEYARTLSPFTGLPWTREEANRLVVIWESIGENDYFEKRISGLIVEMDVELIPDKIDAARNTGSRRLRLLRKPVPFLEIGLPPQFADARILGDITVNHNAIPRTSATLGFERWDKSLMRVFRKRIGHLSDIVTITALDMREFMSTLWITGQTKTRGQSAEGMAVLTPGVELAFVRATNDYHPAPTGSLIQELNGDEPPTGLDGILIQNGSTNRVVNSAFSEGAPNVFTGWTQTIGTGGAIAENLAASIFDTDVQGNAPRAVELTTPTTPADGTELSALVSVDRGDAPLSPQGDDYQISLWHLDNSGFPISVSAEIIPPGFTARQFDFVEGLWVSTATPIWFDLPVRSDPTYDRTIASLQNMEDIPTSPATETLDMKLRIANRTSAAAVNTVYAVQVEGGTLASKEARRYNSNFILTRNGPVVRDALGFFLNNEAQRPIYPADLRGTFAIEFVPLWDAAELPRYTGARRYIYGFVVDADNEDSFYYDADTESFVFLRRISGVSKTATLFYPQITRGVPVQVATRWISDLGDLEETPLSFSFFVNGLQSSSDSHVSKFPLPTSKPLYIGSRDGTDGEMIDAVVRKLEIKQLALPAAAIPRLFT